MADGTTGAWSQRPNAPSRGTILCMLEEIVDGRTKGFSFGSGISVFRMFVVRKGAELYGYLNICPHYSLPLNHRDDEFLTRDGGRIMCRQHLALFKIEDGTCIDGACDGRALDKVPVHVHDGSVILG